MADQGTGSRLQLAIAIAIVVLGGIGWLLILRRDADAVRRHEAGDCWTASCRDRISAADYNKITGR